MAKQGYRMAASDKVRLGMLALAAMAANFERTLFIPFQSAIQSEFHFNDNVVSILAGTSVGIPMGIMAIPSGLYIDRYRRLPAIRLFIALLIISNFIMANAHGLATAAAARIMVGVSMGFIGVASYALVGDVCKQEMRGVGTSIVGMGDVAGAPLAFALAGALLASSAGTHAHDWRWALEWMNVPVLATLGITFLRLEPRRNTDEPSVSSTRSGLVWMLRHWRLLGSLLLARVSVWIVDGAVLVWGGPSLMRRFGVNVSEANFIMSGVLIASGFLGPLLGGVFADYCDRRVGPDRTLGFLVVVSLLSIPATFFPLMPNIASAAVGLGVLYMLGFATGPASASIAMSVLPANVRGAFSGVGTVIAAFSTIAIAPLIVSIVATSLGGPKMLATSIGLACGIASILGAASFGWCKFEFRRWLRTK